MSHCPLDLWCRGDMIVRMGCKSSPMWEAWGICQMQRCDVCWAQIGVCVSQQWIMWRAWHLQLLVQ